MANPQTENGYLRIATELAVKLAKYRISGQEWQILLVILLKTYGFNKKQDRISLSQFVELTGINKPCVIREIKELLSKKIIIIQKDNDFNTTYSIQKDYDLWKPLSKKITSVIQKDNKSLSKKIPTIDIIDNIIDNTPHKKLILHYKHLCGFDKIANWDKVYFGRYCKNAISIIKMCGDIEKAKLCLEWVKNEMEKANLTWNLSTVEKHTERYLKASEKQPDKRRYL